MSASAIEASSKSNDSASAWSHRLVLLQRRLALAAHRLRRLLGIRRGIHIEGVYYKELTPESLARALSKKGRGHKDYRVTFADRSKQVIRCAPDQVYADLMGPIGAERLEVLLPLVRPGDRLLEFDAGTGYRAFWLSFLVGPSGGVVAVSLRPEHAKFAQRRYADRRIAFELGRDFALSGETDGSFDAVVAMNLATPEEQRLTLLRELCRLVRPGGVLLVGIGTGKRDAETGVEPEDTEIGQAIDELCSQSGATVKRVRTGTCLDAVVIFPEEEGSDGAAASGRAGPRRRE